MGECRGMRPSSPLNTNFSLHLEIEPERAIMLCHKSQEARIAQLLDFFLARLRAVGLRCDLVSVVGFAAVGVACEGQ